jgi:hypothetical protein
MVRSHEENCEDISSEISFAMSHFFRTFIVRFIIAEFHSARSGHPRRFAATFEQIFTSRNDLHSNVVRLWLSLRRPRSIHSFQISSSDHISPLDEIASLRPESIAFGSP